MNTAETTNTTRSLLTHDLLLGLDLRRDRYRSGRDRIVANVLYFRQRTRRVRPTRRTRLVARHSSHQMPQGSGRGCTPARPRAVAP
ncbi:MAG: hypothetical protein R2726_05245 [Acidimicrobiales bacterium]